MERNFTELLRRHSSLIKLIIKKFFTDAMEADDVYQEISIHVLSKLSNTKADEFEKWESASWISTITRNKILDIIRANKLINSKNISFEKLSSPQLNSIISQHECEGSRENLKISISELLMNLNDHERKLILLRFVNNYSVQEVGKLLNLSNPSLYIRRALDKLKTELNGKDFFKMYDGLNFEENINKSQMI